MFTAMSRLDIYICTKSKCTAKHAQVKLRTANKMPGAYNGPELLSAIRAFVADEHLEQVVGVHEATCIRLSHPSACGYVCGLTTGHVFSAAETDRAGGPPYVGLGSEC
jgi:hypothetical protein